MEVTLNAYKNSTGVTAAGGVSFICLSTYISGHCYIVDYFRGCFRYALSNREVKHFIFSLNGARGIVSLTNYCQLIKKLTYKEVQVEQINDKQLSGITTSWLAS